MRLWNIFVDECSMIDIMLIYNLLKAVPDTMTLILGRAYRLKYGAVCDQIRSYAVSMIGTR